MALESTQVPEADEPEYETTTPAALGWTKVAEKTWRDLKGRIHQFTGRERLVIRLLRKRLTVRAD
jgi:hypothetical protein